ncbi:MAG: 7-cyano-7-deazaguanine synthase, partial [Verrucomicrobiota bacterium]|nr:7-cyano-7-deazaguanine synthase [Verrucomicrobiota bacterium]
MKAVALFSGGLDSTVLAYKLLAEGADLRLLSVHYGQRHQRELNNASRLAESMRVPHRILEFPELGSLLGGSSLT